MRINGTVIETVLDAGFSDFLTDSKEHAAELQL